MLHYKLKKIIASAKSHYTDPERNSFIRVFPNVVAKAVGPFVALDHYYFSTPAENGAPARVYVKEAHPHRGFIQLTYIIAGMVEHADSIGNRSKLFSGGEHWMNTGSGVLHEEKISGDPQQPESGISVLQFWINLPSFYKDLDPDYYALHADAIPIMPLNDGLSWIKVICGGYETTKSALPSYSFHFLYHLHLEPGNPFSLVLAAGLESAVLLLNGGAVINNVGFDRGELILFESDSGEIVIEPGRKAPVDILLYGGEPYNEAIVIDASFVMNTQHEITQAYNDYYDGKYGEI